MGTSPSGLPLQRSIMAVDTEDSTTRTNPQCARLRELIYTFGDKCLWEAGITDQHRDRFVDRGDGFLTLVHPSDETPKSLLLHPVLTALATRLDEHAAAHPDERLRLRAVVHAGDVLYDDNGCFGEELDLAFRLLDSPRLKQRLRRSSASLMLVVSEHIYRSVVRHGYHGIDKRDFEPLVTVRMDGHQHQGWVRTQNRRDAGGGRRG